MVISRLAGGLIAAPWAATPYERPRWNVKVWYEELKWFERHSAAGCGAGRADRTTLGAKVCTALPLSLSLTCQHQ